jgi:hypothetical protein
MKAIIVCLLLFLIIGPRTSAADVCVYTRQKVSAIYGRVISVGKSPDDPIPQAQIKLLEYRNDEWVGKAEVITSDDGRFSFRSISPGRYHLRASAPFLRTIEFEVKVGKSSSSKKIDREIIIGLEPFGCGDLFIRKIGTDK